MLKVDALQAAYGDSQILFDINFEVGANEAVTLLGRNGMGKTTTIKAIFGLLPPTGGRVTIAGRDLTGARPHLVGQAGLALVPEGRQIFPTLTVEENLVATARCGHRTALAHATQADQSAPAPWALAQVYGLFPALQERRRHGGDQLSGGEQQMLAIGRALMTNPRLLVLDEATEGLAPLVRETIWTCLRRIKETGVGILIIDKNVEALAGFADRHVVIEKGRVVWTGDSTELLATSDVKDRYLHV
jgi:branched-chain amino acid transport system ATP-binding protein